MLTRKRTIISAVLVAGVGAIALAIVGAMNWYAKNYPSYTYRYRTTVEIDVEGVVRSGSSVTQVTVEKVPRMTPETITAFPTVKGEAVFVDLGKGRNLIALMAAGRNGSDVDYPQRIISQLFGLSYEDSDLPKYATTQGSRDLSTNQLPTLVTFSDLNDPKTAAVVRPEEFAQTFGADVRLKRLWIEMTNDPVTRNIEQKMPIIMTALRQEAKVFRIERMGDPFRVNSGQFERGQQGGPN